MLETLVDGFNVIVDQTKNNMHFLSGILALLWGIYFIDQLLGQRLLYFGIQPRRMAGLPGIFCAPFLHAHFNHIFFNSIPLVVLANFVLIQGTPYFYEVSFLIILLSGLMTWLFAYSGIHIGASGVITGYWGLLVSNIYQQGTVVAIILGVICIYYFAGIFLSIFPGKRGVSWQGHLFGLISGLLTSHLMFVLQQ